MSKVPKERATLCHSSLCGKTESQREEMQQKQRGNGGRKHCGYVQPQQHYPINLPQQPTIDELATTTDEELLRLGRQLEQERETIHEARLDPRPWEEEIAYIRREQQIRKTRREAHAAWWSQNYGNSPGSTELN